MVDELRAAGGERVQVHAPAAPPGWADGLAGMSVAGGRDGRWLLESRPAPTTAVGLAEEHRGGGMGGGAVPRQRPRRLLA